MNYSYLKSKSFLWPTILTIVFILVYSFLLQAGQPKYYELTRTLIQWDCQHYLSIARDGYEKFPCGWNPHYICGNIGWFPLLPMISRLPASLGLSHSHALLLTSWLALWLGLLLLFRLVADRFEEKTAILAVLALLLFPGAFYFLTAYPNSLYFLLAVLTFFLIERRYLAWLWLPTGLLAITHPSGAVIGLPVLYVLVRHWREHDARTRLLLLLSLLSIGLAILLFFTYFWIRFDDFFLYIHHQSQPYYAHRVTLPFIPIARLFMQPSADWPDFAMLLFVLLALILFYSRRIPAAWQVFMFALLLFSPTMGTTDSYFRYVEPAFPLYAMIAVRAGTPKGKYLFGAYAVAATVLMLLVFIDGYRAGLLK